MTEPFPSMTMAYWPIAMSTLGIVLAMMAYLRVRSLPVGNDRVAHIALAIRRGAMAFMRKLYGALLVFALMAAVALALVFDWQHSAAFLGGVLGSTIAGFCGMLAATTANSRTAIAASEAGIEGALAVAFTGGAVMGLLVSAFGLLGLGCLYFGFVVDRVDIVSMTLFGLGASSAALFARVAGGVYTKSADVEADLAGKLELGIPEDDPRNPGVIADNVGDNVGDIAGMGADMFESYCNSMVAAIALALVMDVTDIAKLAGTTDALIALPIMLSTAGFAGSILGIGIVLFLARRYSPRLALMAGLVAAGAAYVALSWLVVRWLGASATLWTVTMVGTLGGIVIGLSTHYFTDGRPVMRVAQAGRSGAATVIIAGLTLGMTSMTIPVLALGATILVASQMAGLIGVAIAAVGMLATVGIVMAIDAYGPIADNAGGLAEMAHLGKETRAVTDALDELGNTTAAIGKGFAIGAAALTALAMISAYVRSLEQLHPGFKLELSDPFVLVGLLVGALLPFVQRPDNGCCRYNRADHRRKDTSAVR